MAAISLDKDAFFRRAKRFYQHWKNPSNEVNLNDVDSIVFCVGSDDDVTYSKSIALQTWLFGYELTDTIIVLSEKSIQILASKKKVEFLKAIESSKENEKDVPPVSLLVRDKADKDQANFSKLLDTLAKSRSNGKKVGEFSKDKFSNEFLDSWKKLFDDSNLNTTDVSSSVAYIMAAKEDSEIEIIKKACGITVEVYSKYLREEITEIIDSDKKVKHTKLTEGVDKAMQDKKYIKNLDSHAVDVCYLPIIQSGGNYSLKFSAASDKNNLHFGSIICSLGARYRQYCSNIVRTILVNPTQKQQDLYDFLITTLDAVINKLQDGVKLCDVYKVAQDMLEKKYPELNDKMTKNIGFAMGLEFREPALLIAPKVTAVARKGMVFNVAIGLSNLINEAAKDKESKVYALFVADTVLVNAGKPAEILTNAKRKLKSAAIFLKDDEEGSEEEEEDVKPQLDEGLLGRTGRRTTILNSKLRTEASTEEKRKLHQKELAQQLNEAAKARLAQKSGGKEQQKVRKSNVSYKSINHMPKDPEISELKIFVDRKYETIILPIYGLPVPFHISTIKNISQSVEGDYTYLRINCFHPGSTLTKNESGMYSNLDATFVKEITYRATNVKEPGELSAPSSNLNTAFRLIKEVQKKFRTREAEEREKEGIVKQDTLVISNNKGNPKLKDLYIRPNIYSKRISGTLEAHVNGFRFTSIRGDKVDILYNNIKHAFFQPCDGEMIILIHFTLRNAIMFGKKKHVDVQFYTEVGEITTDLGKHQHMHDRDDLAAEQAERELRGKLKAAFKNFCDNVEAKTKGDIEFDTPFRDLSFPGVPHRSIVNLQPTSFCLVNLTDWPPFVITLDEVELVHFERVQFHLKNFDMVFIFKDYSRKVAMIGSIPMAMLDHVKEWLNQCDIRYSEGIQSLNWVKIMKTITDDPNGFFDQGGWKFLDPQSGDEAEDDDDEDEEDEQYNPTEESDDDDESESDASGSDVTESEDYSEDLGSSEESGKDWSELEEEAARADREKDYEETGEVQQTHRNKKFSKSKHSSGPSKGHSSGHSKSHHSSGPSKDKSPMKNGSKRPRDHGSDQKKKKFKK